MTKILTHESTGVVAVNYVGKANGGFGQDVSTGLVNNNVLYVSGGTITFGSLPAAAIPNTTVTPASYPASGQIPTFTVGADGRLTAAGSTTSGSALTSLNATNLSTGTVAKARGGFGVDVSTGLTNDQVAIVASNTITIGALTTAAVPNLDASKITTGVFAIGRIPTGTSSSTVTIGNDARLNPTPTAAGKVIYDTGTAYAETAAGTTSQVLVGGTTPAFGSVPAAAIPNTAVVAGSYPTSGQLATFTVGADGRLTAAGSSTNGSSLAFLNASSLSSGTVAKARGGFGADVSTGLTNNQVAVVAANAITIGALPFAALPALSDIQTFTSSGTWTKPTVGSMVFILVIGAGGGGGSGRRGASASGGGGGAGGGLNFWIIPKSSLPASCSVTVGTGGGGGAAQTVDSTDGVTGTSGGNSVFLFGGTNWIVSQGGGPGFQGTTSSGGSGSPTQISMFNPNTPGAGSTGAGGSSGFTSALGPGSGGGGGGWNGTTASNGGASFAPGIGNAAPISGGTAPGGNGQSPVFSWPTPFIGLGGTGGAGSGTTAGGTGGNGGTYGAGGGGGGGCANGFNSGAGGNGANGLVLVCTF